MGILILPVLKNQAHPNSPHSSLPTLVYTQNEQQTLTLSLPLPELHSPSLLATSNTEHEQRPISLLMRSVSLLETSLSLSMAGVARSGITSTAPRRWGPDGGGSIAGSVTSSAGERCAPTMRLSRAPASSPPSYMAA